MTGYVSITQGQVSTTLRFETKVLTIKSPSGTLKIPAPGGMTYGESIQWTREQHEKAVSEASERPVQPRRNISLVQRLKELFT